MSTRTAHAPASTPASALDALLATEQEIARQLADADRDARALLDAAQADAAETMRAAAAALERDIGAIDARLHRDITQAVLGIEQEAERQVARYRALTAQQVVSLADDLLAQATGLGAVP